MQSEPPLKKKKFHTDENINNIIVNTFDKFIQKIKSSESNLKAVLHEKFYQPLELVTVFVGRIKNVKDISRTIRVLNEKLPLKSLEHLKRVRQRDIILIPTYQCSNEALSIRDFIDCSVPELQDVFECFEEVKVPKTPPKTVKHFEESRGFWPCNFHPDKYLEKLVSSSFFTSNELQQHRQYMRVVFEIARWYIIQNDIEFINDIFTNINATVVVDPKLQSVVAVSFDCRKTHPMQHSAMLAIDNVARTQNGGAWNTNKEHSGIPEEILPYLKDTFPSIKFYDTDKCVVQKHSKEGPYLCTGYYVYMLKEPCVMCAMALVHARAQRIFFCVDNEECGALKSRTKLQTIASLNHHFEVFTNFI